MKGWLASVRSRRVRGQREAAPSLLVSSEGPATQKGLVAVSENGSCLLNSESNGTMAEASWRPDNKSHLQVRAVLQQQLMHGEAGDGGEGKVSFFRRTLSTLSRRSSKSSSSTHAKAAASGGGGASGAGASASGAASGGGGMTTITITASAPNSLEGAAAAPQPSVSAALQETSTSGAGFPSVQNLPTGGTGLQNSEDADATATRHLHWPHLGLHNAMVTEGEVKKGVTLHASHLPLHLPHLALAHSFDAKGGPASATAATDIFQDAKHSEEVMAQLQEAAQRALKIIEAAKSERETLMQRARQEAQEEARAMRAHLEKEGVQHQRSNSLGLEGMEEEATLQEQKVRNMAVGRIEECVQMCVAHVLNVDTGLPPEKSATLRNIKENPPAFFLKSHAAEFPSVRNHATSHRSGFGRRASGLANQSWDDDEEYFGPDQWVDPCDISNKDVYATILGERSFSRDDGDEFQIDFGELDNPSAFGRVRRAIRATCGCIPG